MHSFFPAFQGLHSVRESLACPKPVPLSGFNAGILSRESHRFSFSFSQEMLSGMLDTVGHSQAPKVLTSHLTQKKLVYKNITLTYFREESGYFWLRYMGKRI
jgi:hypothetical protein